MTRSLGEESGCEVEAYSCMSGFWGGGLKNDLESRQEFLKGGGCEVENALACRVLGGDRFKK